MNAYGVGLGVRQVTGTTEAPLSLRFGPFELDEANARLERAGRALELPPRPFAVLCALARRPGALLTKNALLDEVWGHRFVSESVLKTVIGKLRTALGDDARNPRYIETVARRGYRFVALPGPSTIDEPANSPEASDAGRLTPERALREIRELLRRCTVDFALPAR